jgi:hypothetical protein
MTLRYPKKLVKYRPHRPPQSDRGRKTRKTLHSYAVDKRAVFIIAVDTLLSAGDSRIEYRPHESLAKRYIASGAGDAGGILLGLVIGDRCTMLLLVPLLRLRPS